MSKLLASAAILAALTTGAAADPLPAFYLGKWCGSEGTYDHAYANEADACKQSTWPGNHFLEIRRDGYTLDQGNGNKQVCRFNRIRLGKAWPRMTQDYVREARIQATCNGVPMALSLSVLKGDMSISRKQTNGHGQDIPRARGNRLGARQLDLQARWLLAWHCADLGYGHQVGVPSR